MWGCGCVGGGGGGLSGGGHPPCTGTAQRASHNTGRQRERERDSKGTLKYFMILLALCGVNVTPKGREIVIS